MKENKYRDHYCGKLNNDDIGKTVKVAGFIENIYRILHTLIIV